MSTKTILIYTDGSCIGNPGPGGWACVYKFGTHRKEISGHVADTTNNRMELLAVINALSNLKAQAKEISIEVFTDSQYVRNTISKRWLERWKSNGWRTSNRKPVKNKDLWIPLDRLLRKFSVTFNWIPGHSGIPENERANTLALQAARAARGAR